MRTCSCHTEVSYTITFPPWVPLYSLYTDLLSTFLTGEYNTVNVHLFMPY